MHEKQPAGGENPFGFTRNEALFERMGEKHFLALMRSEDTTIHEAEVSTNLWGEFLFITASRGGGGKRTAITFWGIGFHQRRDRYLLDEWFWYVTSVHGRQAETSVSKANFEQLLTRRKQELEADARQYSQSKQGELFELLADLTDEDGAAAEMDDLGDAAEWLFGTDDEKE